MNKLIEDAQTYHSRAARTGDQGMSDEEAREKCLALLVYGIFLIGYSWNDAAEIVTELNARKKPN